MDLSFQKYFQSNYCSLALHLQSFLIFLIFLGQSEFKKEILKYIQKSISFGQQQHYRQK